MLQRFLTLSFAVCTAVQVAAVAQQPPEAASKPNEPKPAAQNAPPKEEPSVTDHTIKLGTETINYKATAGTILLKNDKDEPTASIFYTAYTQSGVTDPSRRAIAFVYNGGPGSASAWQHMGAFGPMRVVTLDAQPTPPAPYKMVENTAGCLLDATDLVFIDPVGTGFSKAVGKGQDKEFWGIDEDVKEFAQFINTYVSRNGRWNSPKFLIGESYGTFRDAALVNYLQSQDSMYFNGVVMISTVLDLGTLSFNPGDDLPYILYLPSYAAVAWYHNLVKDKPADLNAFLGEARKFAAGEYAAALMKGSTLPEPERQAVLAKLSHFTGLDEAYLKKADLRVNAPQFEAELQRGEDEVTGRLDARYSGPAVDQLAEYPQYDPLQAAVAGAFTAAFNHYIHDDLKFPDHGRYELLSGTVNSQWNWKRNVPHFGFPGAPNVEPDLVEAMVKNTHLKLQVENGLFDLATPFYATEYTMEHLKLPESLRGNIKLDYYNAGHMMYLHEDALKQLRANIESFIRAACGGA